MARLVDLYTGGIAPGISQGMQWAGQAENIRGAQARNRLAEELAPYQVQQAQQRNRLMELTMDDQVRQDEQRTQMGDYKLGAAEREQAAYESQLFMRTLGQDFDQLPPDQQQQRWINARQRAIELDPEDAVLPEQFDPGAYQQIAAMASLGGQGGTNVQSTFRTDDGRLGYVTRDGRTVVTDQQVEGKFQTERYGDQPYVFDPRSGQFLRVGGPMGDAAVSDADRSRYADAGAAIYQTRGQEEARADVQKESAAPKARSKLDSQISRINTVLGVVDEAKGAVSGATAGWGGSVAGRVPGTSAYDLRGTIDTIKANLSFDELQKMRDLSPTGGALGGITERELDLLSSSVQNLDANQSPEQLAKNLGQIEKHYRNYMELIQEGYDRQYSQPGAQQAGQQPPPGYGVQQNQDGSQTIQTPEGRYRREMPQTDEQGWRLMIDANGNKAYVSPDGTQYRDAR